MPAGVDEGIEPAILGAHHQERQARNVQREHIARFCQRARGAQCQGMAPEDVFHLALVTSRIEVARRPYHDDAIRTELARHRGAPLRFGDAQHDIEVARDPIDQLIVERHVERHRGM